MNKKGFSMVALAASLTIVMILLTTVTISVVNSLNNSRKVQFALEINSIEASINTYYVANGEYPTEIHLSKEQFKSVLSEGNLDVSTIIID